MEPDAVQSKKILPCEQVEVNFHWLLDSCSRVFHKKLLFHQKHPQQSQVTEYLSISGIILSETYHLGIHFLAQCMLYEYICAVKISLSFCLCNVNVHTVLSCILVFCIGSCGGWILINGLSCWRTWGGNSSFCRTLGIWWWGVFLLLLACKPAAGGARMSDGELSIF